MDSLDARFSLEDVEHWKKQLREQGYVVLKAVASADEVAEAKNQLWAELQRRRPELNPADPTTWHLLPKPGYGLCSDLAQSQGQWYIRGIPKIKQVFAEIWGTEDLLCSMDCVLLRSGSAAAKTEGLHLDQNPMVKPVCESVQGMMPLLPVTAGTGGLEVVPGSNAETFRTRLARVYPAMSKKSLHDDWCPLLASSGEGGRLYDELLKSARLLLAEPGDLILWDSRTVHGGRLPDEAFKAEEAAAQCGPHALARLSCTIAMTPRAFTIPDVIDAHRLGEAVSLAVPQDFVSADNDVLKVRRAGFENGQCFNHCPHQSESTGTVGGTARRTYQRPVLSHAMELLIDGTGGPVQVAT